MSALFVVLLVYDSDAWATPFTQPNVKLLINGEFRESQASQWVDVTNPVSNQASPYIISSTSRDQREAHLSVCGSRELYVCH